MTEECRFCKYFMPNADCPGTHIGNCNKIPEHPHKVESGGWCNGFECKSEFISVDISRVKDNEHYKASYPAVTTSDIIVSTAVDGTAAVLGVDIQQSYQDQLLNEVEKIKEDKAKKGLEIMGQLNLGVIKVRITKSWEY